MDSTLRVVLSFLSTVLFCIILRSWQTVRRRGGLPLPPGPKGFLPFVGNIGCMPTDHQWLTYAEWAKQYGDIIYVENLGQSMVILNSAKVALDLFEKRSSNYSDRPPMHMANDLMGWDWDFAHMRYGDLWRRHRKTFHQSFQPRAVPAYYGAQVKATNTFLRRLLDSPERFVPYIRELMGAVILRVAYGYDVQPENDVYVRLAKEAMQGLTHAIHPGAFLVDFLPILKYVPSWLPGAGFKRKAKVWKRSTLAVRDEPFQALKASIAEGTAIPSFAADNLEKLKSSDSLSQDQEDIIRNCAAIAYFAGSDTTVSFVTTAILAATAYPRCQELAQAELDAVVGKNRLPGFEDRASLPYVEAFVTECIRWQPVTPMALPHLSIRGDVYEGFYIPPGTTVIGNAWAMLHDEAMYPDPMAFKPERFLGPNKQPDPGFAAFGFGRRICPGRYLAMNSAWLAIASVLCAFRISKALDSAGNEIEPTIAYHSGTVSHARPFECRLTPRTTQIQKVIQSTSEVA